MKFLSRYSNGKEVSAAQYITEVICEHQAKRNKLDLHYRFWVSPEWSKYYRNQIASANKLVIQYHPKAIVRALNDKRAEKIYSLRAPHLLPIIQEYQAQVIAEINVQNPTAVIERKDKPSYRQSHNKTNIFSKLEELDNEP
jgi:hypothetical protein